MEVTGKLIKVFPVQSGVSKSTGKPFAIQQAVIEIPGKYVKKMLFEVFGEDKVEKSNMQEGDNVNITFDIDAREYNGRWYNTVRAFSVVKVNQQAASAPTQQPVPPTPQLFNEEPQNNNSDDLPF